MTISKISANSIRRFVLGEHGRNAGSIAVIGGATRCFLRFLSVSGDRVSELAATISRAADWLPYRKFSQTPRSTNCCSHSISSFRRTGEPML